MNLVFTIMNAILSVLALAGTVFVYFKHDRKLKKQGMILNDLQIAKETQPDVVARLDRERKCICICNQGPVCAKNVEVEVPPEICNRPREFPFPMDVEARQEVPISVYLGINGPNKIIVSVAWDCVGQNEVVGKKKRAYSLPTNS